MSHNSIVTPGEGGAEQPNLPFRLTGSQAKTAYALELNVARMIKEAGIENVAFLTLTVGDESGEGFRQVWDSKEASRRINSLTTNLLRGLFPRSVIVTERHKSGAIHFHLIVQTRNAVRGYFDFAAFLEARKAREDGGCDAGAEKRYADSATPQLRALWAILRERLPGYGFGRAELTPIFKGGEAVSRYVAKYVEKNLFNRLAEDRGKRLVRYSGWEKAHLKASEFAWANARATAWRGKVEVLSRLAGVASPQQASQAFGPRWAFKLTRIMHAVDHRPLPYFEWSSMGERETVRSLVANIAKHWVMRHERQRLRAEPSAEEWRLAA